MVRPLNNNVPEGRSVAYKQFSNMTVSNWLVTLYPQNSKFNSCKNFCVEIHCAIYKQNTKKQRKVAWKILSKYMYIRGRLLTFFFCKPNNITKLIKKKIHIIKKLILLSFEFSLPS